MMNSGYCLKPFAKTGVSYQAKMNRPSNNTSCGKDDLKRHFLLKVTVHGLRGSYISLLNKKNVEK